MKINEEFLDFIGLMVAQVNEQEKRIARLEREQLLSMIEKLAARVYTLENKND